MSARALKLLARLSMVVALAGAILIAAWSQLNAYLVGSGPATAETVVVFPRGAGLGQIAATLVEAGVIDHPWLFRLAVREGLTVAEIFQLLENADALQGALPPPPEEGSLLPETYFYAFGDSRV